MAVRTKGGVTTALTLFVAWGLLGAGSVIGSVTAAAEKEVDNWKAISTRRNHGLRQISSRAVPAFPRLNTGIEPHCLEFGPFQLPL
ncbi:hypothetical protein HOY82DRAFT_212719 [Tuber indicum]|nr:hypothetical protein HOY82DRAFT_212719 [Tuber indicum]